MQLLPGWASLEVLVGFWFVVWYKNDNDHKLSITEKEREISSELSNILGKT